jgi:hypothetical protein
MYQHYVLAMFKRLDDDPSASEQEVTGLEWTYYGLLEHTDRPAKRLQGAIAADPGFFIYLLGCFYFPEGKDSCSAQHYCRKLRARGGWRGPVGRTARLVKVGR